MIEWRAPGGGMWQLETTRARVAFLMSDKAKVNEELVDIRHHMYAMAEFRTNVERMLDVQVPAIRRTIMITDEELRNTQHESLVLWTVHDPTAPTTVADKMADLLPNSKKVILDGAGHWPQWEIPELFNQVHIDFLHGKDIVL